MQQVTGMRNSVFLVVAALVLAEACRGRDTPQGDTLLAVYTAAERAHPSPSRPLGGINVWGYCQSLGYPTVGYRRGIIEGPQAAYDNWVCQRGTDQLKPVEPKLVDMGDACAWQFKRPATARPDNPDHAWSWNCYPAQ
jgi:hypothetical protein